MQEILAVVFLIGILVFVHEFGHFIVGKIFGFGVETFSIGFGPRIFGIRKSGTDYRLSIIPLGGYVKFAGTVPSEPVPDRFVGKEIYKKPVWQRALMTFAGPFANLLLAIVAYSYLGGVGIKHEAPVVGQTRPGGVAEKAGFLPGDEITSIAGKQINKWSELVTSISASGGEEIEIKWLREGQVKSAYLVPEYEETEDIKGNNKKVGRIGISHGFLPSKIAVIHDSKAQDLGFNTGMHIYSLSASGVRSTVKTFHELVAKVGAMYKSNATNILLHTKGLGSTDDKIVDAPVVLSFDGIKPIKGITNNYLVGANIFKQLGISDTSLTIAKVSDKFAGSAIKQGDFVEKIGGSLVTDIFDLQYFLVENKKPEVEVGVVREGKLVEFSLKLNPVEIQKAKGKDIFYAFPGQFMGERIKPKPYVEKYDGALASVWYGVKHSLKLSGEIVGALIGLITGDVPLGALGGPMLIAKVAGESAALGLTAYLGTLAIISINLCMINLFPIPVLDGGQLVMLAAEAVKGSMLSEAAIENYQKIGFVMVMGLVLLSTYNDLGRFWASMLRTVGGAQ
jgi:regulator of sigma E protease